MNTKRINILLVLVILCTAISLKAQNEAVVRYTYDGNGNRITRTLQFRRLEDPKGEATKNDAAAECSTEDMTGHFAAADITLFPNPTYGHFQVKVERMDGNSPIHAIITTLAGAVINERQIADGLNNFDIGTQPAGIYFLRLTSGQETCVWKIIKQ